MANEQKLSVSLALEQVKEACAVERKIRAEHEFARKDRNRYIKEAAKFVPVTQLMKVTGMGRDTLYKIKNSPDD